MARFQISPIPMIQTYSNAPSLLLINLSTKFASWTDTTPGSILINGNTWSATVNITPNISDCLNYTTPAIGNNVTFLTRCNGSDITVTVVKNGVTSLNRAVVDSNIIAGQNYLINLLDAAYGLQSAITYPANITFSTNDPRGNLTTATVTPLCAYQLQSNYTYSVPLGALEYRANNNYWIPQNYYYQMGGVFLEQSDGVTPIIPPSITFTYNNTPSAPITVNIDAIAFDQSNVYTISGTTPIQVGTKMESNSGNLPYAAITANTMNVSINFTTPVNDPNTIQMWKQYFQNAANVTGGIPGDGIQGDPPNLYMSATRPIAHIFSYKGLPREVTLRISTSP